ncbi:hypothetical protein H312_03181 [Anncaliia algerae PRA339]|uniref:Trafficking protein particle complex subunit n=1 Tax=Anncaliia algerae PRA339 TaxID=1288291 RepID=A0A059EWZ3_9MICR|nr:hypothetical protein H312_03181 [Anncaliia algerae PRA339]
MSELFLILDRNNKILNSYEKDLEDDIKYCKLYSLAYSSLDVIDVLNIKSNDSFFYCIIKYKYVVSLYIMRSGRKILLITHNRSKENIRKISESIYLFYKTYYLNNFEKIVESKEFDKKMQEILSTE